MSERHSVASQKTRIPRNMSLPSLLEWFGTNLESAGGSLHHGKGAKAQLFAVFIVDASNLRRVSSLLMDSC